MIGKKLPFIPKRREFPQPFGDFSTLPPAALQSLLIAPPFCFSFSWWIASRRVRVICIKILVFNNRLKIH